MSTVAEAAVLIRDALKVISTLRIYTDTAQPADPPAVIIGPPNLRWEAACSDPSHATFPLYLVLPWRDRVMEQMWDLVPEVAAAVEAVRGVVVTGANPGIYSSPSGELPSYTVTCQVALS
ncbi:hypothetical protein [Pseudonocardia sp. WMMC193]|uniref:hypothetical protein n=1 Tax=Pseudonocardia sp. WMMC193 TaxID=2911965 RepID=UPI001F24B94A|nr:hypothetical protein [Pseudonocardia sp. WMMC193]MCF7548903.1 hypothetical protein [Pseudonocardia sp. WMMC193]